MKHLVALSLMGICFAPDIYGARLSLGAGTNSVAGSDFFRTSYEKVVQSSLFAGLSSRNSRDLFGFTIEATHNKWSSANLPTTDHGDASSDMVSLGFELALQAGDWSFVGGASWNVWSRATFDYPGPDPRDPQQKTTYQETAAISGWRASGQVDSLHLAPMALSLRVARGFYDLRTESLKVHGISAGLSTDERAERPHHSWEISIVFGFDLGSGSKRVPKGI